MISKRSLLLFSFLLAIQSSFCQNIDSLVKLRVEWGDTPGIVVGVFANGKTSYYAYGFANVEKGVRATPKTLFEIGSITKTFTCLLLAEAIEKGRVSLSDPVQKFLPAGLRMPELNGKIITLEYLATARSGLPRMPANFAPANPQNPFIDYTKKELYAFLNGYVLPREPGSRYEYSNIGMGLLAFILSNVKTYSELVESGITGPLHMDQTVLNTADNTSSDLAQGYSGGVPVRAWTWTNESVMAGAGGLISHAEDMMKYVIANANESGPLGSAMAMTHQARYDAGEDMQIGLGWHVKNKIIVWHNGGTAGFRSFAGFNSQSKSGVVVLTNSSIGADDLGFYLLDPSLPLKTPRKSISVDENILIRYVGEYEMSPQFKIVVTYKTGSLYGQATGQRPFQLYAETNKKFFLKEVDAQIEFVLDEHGGVEKLLLYQGGAIQAAKKIN